MADKIIYKAACNAIDKGNWIEDRESLVQRLHPVESTFLNIAELRKSGRDLQMDLENTGITSAPRKFVELSDIKY